MGFRNVSRGSARGTQQPVGSAGMPAIISRSRDWPTITLARDRRPSILGVCQKKGITYVSAQTGYSYWTISMPQDMFMSAGALPRTMPPERVSRRIVHPDPDLPVGEAVVLVEVGAMNLHAARIVQHSLHLLLELPVVTRPGGEALLRQLPRVRRRKVWFGVNAARDHGKQGGESSKARRVASCPDRSDVPKRPRPQR